MPPHRGVMGAILPGLEGEGITRKLLVYDLVMQRQPLAERVLTML